MAEAALGLGSNLGDRSAHLAHAVAALSLLDGVDVRAISSLWETPPWGIEDQPIFLNACVLIETSLPPHELLDACLAIERVHGRERSQRWGPRTLDMDLLFHGETELATGTLTLPHPRLTERSFVLAPLAEIAPDKVISGRTVAEHLQRLSLDGIVNMGPMRERPVLP